MTAEVWRKSKSASRPAHRGRANLTVVSYQAASDAATFGAIQYGEKWLTADEARNGIAAASRRRSGHVPSDRVVEKKTT